MGKRGREKKEKKATFSLLFLCATLTEGEKNRRKEKGRPLVRRE